VGSSSGFSLATNLGQMVQATVWNKALASTVSQSQPKAMTIADLVRISRQFLLSCPGEFQEILYSKDVSQFLKQPKEGKLTPRFPTEEK